ncbi:hypothetical protein [Arsukibacterium sp.]|uniref:hypothetical protein n=1 Tax=Arsukibacterium sp. TaxID=1977258 RepID=UPI00299DEAF3|nr:hypothetical protein [Arsukibacterium sp.]MDX1678537.1 hypothetical protein [Arsukibacterium sp.]
MPKPVGFRWFIPALIKYRHLFADVLMASLFIQLVGLATPIFFQVTKAVDEGVRER